MTIFRSDDFSPALTLEVIRGVHVEFIQRGLIERAVIQVCDGERCGFSREVLGYLRSAPNYEFQLHCWRHDRYFEWSKEAIIIDLSSAISYIRMALGARPTIMHPPWNAIGGELPAACKALGLTLDRRGAPILKFLENPEKCSGKDINAVFFHIKNERERIKISELLDYFQEVEE